MNQPAIPNLLIFVADALRRDYYSPAITNRGTYIDTRANGFHTPTNFPSILAGAGLDTHGVRRNDETVAVPTVMDLDQLDYDTSLWPSHEQAMMSVIFGGTTSKPLIEMEPPFVYVERCLATHNVYGRCDAGCGMTLDREHRTHDDGERYGTAKEYYLRMKQGETNHMTDYETGVHVATARFFELMEVLVEQGWYDDTFVVFTSDHGEAFPEDGRQDVMHRMSCPETHQVGTAFYDREIDPWTAGPFMSSDIIQQWWPDIRTVLKSLDPPTAPDVDEGDLQADLEALGYL